MGPRRIIPTTNNNNNPQERRKCIYLKRLDIDLEPGFLKHDSPISRRTRRQSMYRPTTLHEEKRILHSKTKGNGNVQKTGGRPSISDASTKSSGNLVTSSKEKFCKVPVKTQPSNCAKVSKISKTSSTLSKTGTKVPEKTLPSQKRNLAQSTKIPTPVIRKPLKRLTETGAPKPQRLTRSAVKKSGKNPQLSIIKSSEKVKKTPVCYIKKLKPSVGESNLDAVKNYTKISVRSPSGYKKQVCVRKLNAFTPKPDEPSKLLRQSLKRHVEAELKNLAAEEISSGMHSNLENIRLEKSGTNKMDEDEAPRPLSFVSLESPVSSRKSILTRRISGSSAASENESRIPRFSSPPSPALQTNLSSTPKGKTNNDREFRENLKLMDLSGMSSSDESDFSRSFTKSVNGSSTMEAEPPASKEQRQQQNRRGYCELM